jgi:hypothetical protein
MVIQFIPLLQKLHHVAVNYIFWRGCKRQRRSFRTPIDRLFPDRMAVPLIAG